MRNVMDKKEWKIVLCIICAVLVVSLLFVVFEGLYKTPVRHTDRPGADSGLVNTASSIDALQAVTELAAIKGLDSSNEIYTLLIHAINAADYTVRQSLVEQAAKLYFGEAYSMHIYMPEALGDIHSEYQSLINEYPSLETQQDRDQNIDRRFEIVMLDLYNRP